VLALGERRAACRPLPFVQLGGEPRLDLGREHGPAPGDGHDRVADLLASGLLGQIALGAGGHGLVGKLATEVRGQQDDLGDQPIPPHRAQDVEPVQIGHLDVQDGDVRLAALDLVQRLAASARLRDHFQIGTLADRPDHPLAIDRMVVREDDANALVPPLVQRCRPNGTPVSPQGGFRRGAPSPFHRQANSANSETRQSKKEAGSGHRGGHAAETQPPPASASAAMAALRPLSAITEPAGWVAAPHR
jgi:hypothetical protein